MPEARADRQRAREVQSGATRAAVLGLSDGLVTNVALILGVAGAQASGRFVLLAGFASLVAGAASMAVGEYVSMAAQVELLQRLLADYREHLRRAPEQAREEIEEFIRRGGVSQATAHNASQQIAMVPDRALAVYARSLGLDPDELGSPWKAAITSLLTFAGGALLPLVPWFFWTGTEAAVGSIALGAASAIAVGGMLGYLGGRNVAWNALRQLVALALAAAATWGAGRLFNATVT
ncbi:MAG TPA: VIT1/CCC1 transporter family protein [Myxococcales bacterium]|jgi:VIT1/CCC1 family predicted Fe2+/Mn2+ transporter|nr:VIT1/CCC1 transporter family protein [Myxococcales bacterium]